MGAGPGYADIVWQIMQAIAQVSATAGGTVDAALVRTFNVGSQVEGCVADDEQGYFYISEEAIGIWKYGAEPEAGIARTQVDTTGAGGHLTSSA